MDPAREREYIDRARSGSVDAFAALVDHHRDRLLRYLMLRGLQRADAEDAAQTAFISAWEYLDSFNPRWRFSTWLYRIAQRSIKPAGEPGLVTDPEQLATSTDSTLQSQMQANLWAVARDHLDSRVFAALWLRYGEGFTNPEVARILEASPVWVRVNLMRARRSLKRHLTGAKQRTVGAIEHDA